MRTVLRHEFGRVAIRAVALDPRAMHELRLQVSQEAILCATGEQVQVAAHPPEEAPRLRHGGGHDLRRAE